NPFQKFLNSVGQDISNFGNKPINNPITSQPTTVGKFAQDVGAYLNPLTSMQPPSAADQAKMAADPYYDPGIQRSLWSDLGSGFMGGGPEMAVGDTVPSLSETATGVKMATKDAAQGAKQVASDTAANYAPEAGGV